MPLPRLLADDWIFASQYTNESIKGKAKNMFLTKQISSLHKVRECDPLSMSEISKETLLRGERFAYQISLKADEPSIGNISIESPLLDYIRVYKVEQSAMDAPVTEKVREIGYITTDPGLMPDLLLPIENNDFPTVTTTGKTLWIEVNIPNDMEAGEYKIDFTYHIFSFTNPDAGSKKVADKTMIIDVLPLTKKEQSLIYTRWFYADCIVDYHNVPIYSDVHFDLIEAYIREAVDVGINIHQYAVRLHTRQLVI